MNPHSRVLVIEDDKDIVELVRYNLEKNTFQVVACGDGASGLAQIRKSSPDLLILDLMLPKLSGLEICKKIRRLVAFADSRYSIFCKKNAETFSRRSE